MIEGLIIRNGLKEDASFIGKTITEAMGHELCVGLAAGKENLHKVLKLFTDLAATDTAQYSYKNTLVAVDKDGKRSGAIIAYDGAGLREMRKDFIAKVNELLGWNVTVEEADNWEPETNSNEIYLDSLYVISEYRNQGIATSLIKAAIDRYKNIGKPFGLLVEPHNTKAHKLYKELGFKEDGVNNFCGEPMIHLIFKMKDDIKIRRSVEVDVEKIMTIFDSAKRYMRANNNLSQWSDSYPNEEIIRQDIENGNSYVGENNRGELILTFAFIKGEDPTYHIIKGKWINNDPYGTIHRIASNGKTRGVLKRTCEYCFNEVENIRIDTHKDNHPMLHSLENLGFRRCGEIICRDGTARIAFQKLKYDGI